MASFLTGAGCSASAPRAGISTQGSLVDKDGNDAGLPSLAQGLHLGFTSFVDIDDPTGVDELTTTALAAGMDIGRVWLDWVEVERDAGQAGLDDIADKWGELMGSWGLVTFDLEPKPAWAVFLDALARSCERDG